MQKEYLRQLKEEYTEKAMSDMENEFRQRMSEPHSAVYATAYVISKSNKIYNSLYDFLSDCNADKCILDFVKDNLEGNWDLVMKYQSKFSKQVFESIVLYNDCYELKSYSDGTPFQLSKLACKILDIADTDSVADYCTRQGSFIVQAVTHNDKAYYYGNDGNTSRICIALMKADLLEKNITFEEKDTFSIEKKYDKIFSSYPFAERFNENRNNNEVFQFIKQSISKDKKTVSTDWLFNTMIINTLKETGKAVVVVTPGSLFNNSDTDVRKYFIENGYIESVIALPSRLFESTASRTCLMVLSHGNNAVKFVDARGCYVSGRRQNELSDKDIADIMKMLEETTDISKEISNDAVREKCYSLDVSEYLKKELSIKDGITFGKIIKSVRRGTQMKASEIDSISSNEPTPYRYLTLTDINDGIINDSLAYLTNISERLEKYCVNDRNIIISKCGAPIKVAVAEIKSWEEVLANSNLYIIELDEEKANPYFIKAFFESETGKAQLNVSSAGLAVTTISLETLKNLTVPCPPIEIQNEIAEQYIQAKYELEKAKYTVETIKENISCIYDNYYRR